MAKYRKKPVVVEAEQFYEVDTPESGIADYFMAMPVKKDRDGLHLIIPTLEGDMRANLGDWIIVGVKNEIYPCKPDIFKQTYELVEG